jgi:uncharacterized protein YcfJ
MKAINVFGISVLAVALSGSAALAKSDAASGAVSPLPKATTLADNVVVSPNNTPTPAPAPAPAPTVNVQPSQQAQPVQAAPVVAPTNRTVVTEDRPHNYMATIAGSAFLGAVAGALIGGAIYFLDTPRDHAERIGYWAAGGVLVGTGIGIINVVADENRSERAVATRLPSDPVPTYRVSLLQTHF